MDIRQYVHDIMRAAGKRPGLLVVPRALAQYMGSLEGGVFLAQLVVWSNDDWVVRTYGEWEEATLLLPYKVRRCAAMGEARGFLQTHVEPQGSLPVLYYRLDLARLSAGLAAFLNTVDAQAPVSQQTMAATFLWQATLDELQGQMARATYDFLLRSSRLMNVESQLLVLGVPSAYAAEWINHRLKGAIEWTVNALARTMAQEGVRPGPYQIRAVRRY